MAYYSSKKTSKYSLRQLLPTLLILLLIPLTILGAQHAQQIFTHASSIVQDTAGYAVQDGKLIHLPVGIRSPHGVTSYSSHTSSGAIPVSTVRPATDYLHSQGITNPSNADLPSSIDLSAYNPPVGDQDSVQFGIGSCTAWAVDHYLRGWYAKKYGNYPAGGGSSDPNNLGGFAPMYLYSQFCSTTQEVRTCGISLEDAAKVLNVQGADTRSDYFQGDYNWSIRPTTQEKNNAAQYAISSYGYVVSGHNKNHVSDSSQYDRTIQTALEESLTKGEPIAITIPIFSNFHAISPSNFILKMPRESLKFPDVYESNHAVFAFGYDENGLWVLNQWGTNWGKNGAALISWDYVNQYLMDALTIQIPACVQHEGICSPHLNSSGSCSNPKFSYSASSSRYDNSCNVAAGQGCCLPNNTNSAPTASRQTTATRSTTSTSQPVYSGHQNPLGYVDKNPNMCTSGVTGWVCAKDASNTAVKVDVYMDGSYWSGGKYLGETTANKPAVSSADKSGIASFCNGSTANHRFALSFSASQFPALYDGKKHTIYVHAIGGGNPVLGQSGQSLTCQKPSTSNNSCSAHGGGCVSSGLKCAQMSGTVTKSYTCPTSANPVCCI